jgi:hypothetical protein
MAGVISRVNAIQGLGEALAMLFGSAFLLLHGPGRPALENSEDDQLRSSRR